MHSFRKDAASIVDHHTASQQFLTHDLREKRVGRECPAQWSWIVPPLGGSLTSVFHHEMRHFDKDPRFIYQVTHRQSLKDGVVQIYIPSVDIDKEEKRVPILVASQREPLLQETGACCVWRLSFVELIVGATPVLVKKGYRR